MCSDKAFRRRGGVFCFKQKDILHKSTLFQYINKIQTSVPFCARRPINQSIDQSMLLRFLNSFQFRMNLKFDVNVLNVFANGGR